MIDFVESVVSKFPKLSCQMNKGDRLRIMRDGWYGSLWATYKKNTDKYRFLVTGDVVILNWLVNLHFFLVNVI